MSASLDDFASAMRESLRPHAARLLAEVRALQPKETGLLVGTAPDSVEIGRGARRRTVRVCVLVAHKLSAEMEREGQSAVGVTTPEQAWPLTRGLLDIALTSDRAEQLSSD